jgi:hypothetical protein
MIPTVPDPNKGSNDPPQRRNPSRQRAASLASHVIRGLVDANRSSQPVNSSRTPRKFSRPASSRRAAKSAHLPVPLRPLRHRLGEDAADAGNRQAHACTQVPEVWSRYLARVRSRERWVPRRWPEPALTGVGGRLRGVEEIGMHRTTSAQGDPVPDHLHEGQARHDALQIAAFPR